MTALVPQLVAPGVRLLPLSAMTLPPATHTNCYLLGERRLVLVDPATPFADEQERLLAAVRGAVAAGGELVEIWLTHHHHDHVGAAARLRDELRVGVAAHALTAEALQGEVAVDHLIADGDAATLVLADGAAARWVALHTPGHARGHLCFYEPRTGALLTGDNVVGEGTVLIAPPDGDMADYFRTLHRLRALAPRLLLPGHGDPITAADDKLAFYLAHRTAREQAILTSLAAAPLSPSEIVTRVYTDVDPRAYPLAELNVRAHLDKLVAEGRAQVEGERFAAV